MLTLTGPATVESIAPRGPPEPVYNLEVQVDHVYHVAQSGVLVHNGVIHESCFIPTNEAKKNFGSAVHQDFPNELAKQYPGTHFKENVKAGMTGPDAEFRGGVHPGFDLTDLKPRTQPGYKSFQKQLENWGDGDAALFFYDPATGVIDIGNPFIYRQL